MKLIYNVYISQIFLTKCNKFSLDISLLWFRTVCKNECKSILLCPSTKVIFFFPPISIQSSNFVPRGIDFYLGKVSPQCVPTQMPFSHFLISIICSLRVCQTSSFEFYPFFFGILVTVWESFDLHHCSAVQCTVA